MAILLGYALLGGLIAWIAGRAPFRRGTVLATIAAVGLPIGLEATFADSSLRGPFFLRPALAGLLGCWLVAAIQGGKQTRRRLLLWLGLPLLLLSATVLVLLALALDSQPFAFQPLRLNAAEKRRLIEQFRNSPTIRQEGQPLRRLRLAEADLNRLLVWALSAHWPDCRARIQLTGNQAALRTSLQVPIPYSQQSCYLNLCFTGHGGLTDHDPRLRLRRVEVGSLTLPEFLVDRLSVMLETTLATDPQAQQLLAAVTSLEVREGRLRIVGRKEAFTRRFLPALVQRLGPNREVFAATRVHIEHLVDRAEQLAHSPKRFEKFLQAAFALAQERSQTHDPVVENQAALLALAALFGPADVSGLLPPRALPARFPASRDRMTPVKLRGRRDWALHFYGSAVLTVLSNAHTSDAIGVLKEEWDAVDGGSGFSFTDLLADRAGTLLARAAIRNEQSARALQNRLGRPFDLDAVFPRARDLPEGLSESAFQKRYGGLDGSGYRAVEREIQRRLATCSALQ